jgi:hypothetical protein
VVVNLKGEIDQLSRFRPGRAQQTPAPAVRAFDPAAVPLEALVEREVARNADPLNRRLTAEAGLHFLRLLAANGAGSLRAAYLAQYPVPSISDADRELIDDDSAVFVQMIAGRSLNGDALYADLLAALRPATGTPALPAQPVIPGGQVAPVTAAAQAFIDWYQALFSQPNPDDRVWSGDRMEYAFGVSAAGTGGEVVLEAPAYSEGKLDWHDVDLDRSGTPLAGTNDLPAPTPVDLLVQPSTVAFKGMPAHRFWEFEDAQIDLGALDVSSSDLPRLLLMEFAFLHGNDWFMIPWQVPVGSLARVDTFTVTDTFGDVKEIPAARDLDPGFSMFRLTETNVPAGAPPRPFKELLYVAPTVIGGMGGRTLEEVVLARDEMANLAWGIERTVVGPRDRAMSRHEAYLARVRRHPPDPPAPPAPGNEQSQKHYILQTTIPDYWMPMVPIQVPNSNGQVRFRRGLLDRPGGPIPAQGKLLEPEHALIMHEEEIPRIGNRVTRNFQTARWVGGQTHLWIGRRKVVSHGESSSGLRYDQVE